MCTTLGTGVWSMSEIGKFTVLVLDLQKLGSFNEDRKLWTEPYTIYTIYIYIYYIYYVYYIYIYYIYYVYYIYKTEMIIHTIFI